MLYDVVAVLVLEEVVRVLVQLLQDGRGLLRGAVLENALNHAATIRVGRQAVHLRKE